MKKFIVTAYCVLIAILISSLAFPATEQRKATEEDLERGVGSVISAGGHSGNKINLGSFSDNQYFRVSYDNAYSGTGTATTGAPRLFFGTNTPSGDDSVINVGRAISGDALFSHAFRDESTFTSTSDSAYTSFDAAPTINGSTAYNHSYGFQARTTYQGDNVIDTMTGFIYLPTTNTGTVTNMYGFRAANPLGTGPIDFYAGIWFDNITRGTAKYSIYSYGDQPSYHKGLWQTGGNILAAGNITGSNIGSSNANQSVSMGDNTADPAVATNGTFIGWGAGAAADNSDLNTLVGVQAGASITTGSRNAIFGANAGYDLVTGDNNVMIGPSAGRGETGSGKLFIDIAPTAGRTNRETESMIYGVANDNASLQTLSFNAAIVNIPLLPTYDNNTAASGGGLAAGRVYKTSTGVLMVVY